MIQLSEVVAGSTVREAATRIPKSTLDHFPPLISDICLSDAASTLSDYVNIHWQSDTILTTEIITMPRDGFSPRPVILLTAASRVLYRALTQALDAHMPQLSRDSPWQEHRRFGTESTFEYIVDLDVAACYEYIDLGILEAEILLRSSEFAICNALIGLIRKTMPLGRGLPQMIPQSDALSDVYLGILDRKILREEWDFHRYADDIRVLASNWEQANQIVETAAEELRAMGLILAGHKTSIQKISTVQNRLKADEELFDEYTQSTTEKLALVEFFSSGPYADDDNSPSIEGTQDDPVTIAARKIIAEVTARSAEQTAVATPRAKSLRSLVPRALKLLYEDASEIDAENLSQLAFIDPRLIEDVVKYIGSRQDDFTEALEKIISLKRQSPWFKLWILFALEKTGTPSEKLSSWATTQLTDTHEVVRAQAAWTAACKGTLTLDQVKSAYSSASELTASGIAASAAKQGTIPSKVLEAIRGDSPLNKEAMRWAEK